MVHRSDARIDIREVMPGIIDYKKDTTEQKYESLRPCIHVKGMSRNDVLRKQNEIIHDRASPDVDKAHSATHERTCSSCRLSFPAQTEKYPTIELCSPCA